MVQQIQTGCMKCRQDMMVSHIFSELAVACKQGSVCAQKSHDAKLCLMGMGVTVKAAAQNEHVSPVLLSLLSIIHEAVKELVSVLFAELPAVGLQSLHGLLVLLLTLS